MPTLISTIETLARQTLNEPTPRFWSSDELVQIIIRGAKDLWRPIVDLKQEHFLKINETDVTFPANSSTLLGVPTDVHKVYMIEALNTGTNAPNTGLIFTPLDRNHKTFQLATSRDAISPSDDTIFYCITGQGSPVNAPTIYAAPQVSTSVTLRFGYIPTLNALTSSSTVPIPGECDNALIAWTVAFARAKEREDRSPDPAWLAVYATEKQNLLESLGLRQYQEPIYVDAIWQEYW